MHWNYRLLQHEVDGEPVCEIVEAFYSEEAMGINTPMGWAEACSPYGECPEDVKQVLEWMALALEKPVLTPESFSPLEPEDFKAEKGFKVPSLDVKRGTNQ